MRTLGSAIQNTMKFIAIAMLVSLIAKAFFDIFTGCSDDKYNVQMKMTMYEIDSVDYHYMGRDNTLQSTQYWKLRLKGTDRFIHAYRPYSVGDSITVTEKFYQKK